ncbi:MAG: hypothetical protein P8X79_01755 [Reinekea sp.]
MIPLCFRVNLQFLTKNRNQALTLCIHFGVTDSGSTFISSK